MEAVSIIKAALNRLDDIDGWYALGGVGIRLLAEMPDFDPRSYGCPKLSQLVDKCGAFDVRCENLMVYICPKCFWTALHLREGVSAHRSRRAGLRNPGRKVGRAHV